MNELSKLVWDSFSAAMNNAAAEDTEAVLEALRVTEHRVRVLHLRRHAREDGVVQIPILQPAEPEPSRYPVLTRAQAEIVRDQEDAPSAA